MLDGVVAIPIREWTPKLETLQEREDADLTNYNVKGVNDLRQVLFSNISVTELANPAVRLAALILKRKFLHELLRRNLPHRAVRQNTSWLYAGSGLDLYSLLFLGAENIVLIDPIFKKKSAIARVKNLAGKVILYDSNRRKVKPEVFQIDDDQISFELNLGEGPTEINVRWVACNFEDYQPKKQERVGVIMGLIQPEIQLDICPAINHLEPGGYIICDWPLRSRFDGQPPREAPINKHALRERRKQFKDIYGKKGFSYIVIGENGQILKKRTNS